MAAPVSNPPSDRPSTAPVSQVYTWEPSSTVLAARYGLQPSDILRFDLNTSPLPAPDLAAALAGPFDPPINEYPDSMYADLAEAAAAYVGVDPSLILVGAGADEVLDIIAKTFLPPGGRAVVPIPTYSMYGVLSTQRSATLDAILRLPASAGFGIDLERLLPRLAGADLVWLCAPNNPTGAPEPLAVIGQVLDAAAASGPGGPIVVVDEAYAEFSTETSVSLIERYPALVVVRTVSKAFALAGMRVGYAIAQRSTVERMERLRPPGSVSTVSAAVAAAALRDPGHARRNAAELGRERDWLAERLAECRSAGVSQHHQLPAGSHRVGRGSRGAHRRAAPGGHRHPHVRTRQPAAGPPSAHGPDASGERATARGAGRMAGREGRMTTSSGRTAVRERTTRETTIRVRVDLDGSGRTTSAPASASTTTC